MNSVASKKAIAVRTSSSGAGLTMRRSEVRHRSVISSRSRRRISRSSDGVRRGSSSAPRRIAQRRSATSVVRRRASVGCAVRTGETSSRAISASSSASVRPSRRSPAIASATESGEDPVACRALAPAQRPDPAARLGQVDQPEIEREGADDGLRRAQVEAAELLVEALALDRIVVAAERDRPLPDPLDEREQLGAGLLGDDLAEQRPEQPDLDGERVARAGRPDPERLGGDRRRDAAAAVTRRHAAHAHGTVQVLIRHRTATFSAATFLYACIVMPMTSIGSASTPARAAGRKRPRVTPPDADDQLEQLRFLHEVARLATTARTWDELLETVVDRTRDVLHADVSSLYLLDRDGAYLTLAATNGLDRFQIGRARVPFGEGVTGRVAARRASRWSSPTSRPTTASCGSAASTSAASWRRCCPCR